VCNNSTINLGIDDAANNLSRRDFFVRGYRSVRLVARLAAHAFFKTHYPPINLSDKPKHG